MRVPPLWVERAKCVCESVVFEGLPHSLIEIGVRGFTSFPYLIEIGDRGFTTFPYLIKIGYRVELHKLSQNAWPLDGEFSPQNFPSWYFLMLGQSLTTYGYLTSYQ